MPIEPGQMDDDRESVLVSALEHFAYCPRQCALIHIEQTFTENLYTLKGQLAHKRVDEPTTRSELDARVERGLPLWSRRLELVGRADVVEFREGVPYPVEYKVGKRRDWEYEAIQLCAQALCLEEMLACTVPCGAIYYVSSRARREVIFDDVLRALVERCAREVRVMLASGALPTAPNDERCPKCSLVESCLPGVVVRPGRLRYEARRLFAPLESRLQSEREAE